VALGLPAVLAERVRDLLVLGLLCEFVERVEEFVLGVVDVFEVVHEQLTKVGH